MSEIRLGKKLYIPGRVWTSAQNFVEAFPWTKTSFAVVVIYDFLKAGRWPANCNWVARGGYDDSGFRVDSYLTRYPPPIPNTEMAPSNESMAVPAKYMNQGEASGTYEISILPRGASVGAGAAIMPGPPSCPRPYADWRPTYDLDRKYRVHKDVIRYALSPVKPIDFYFDISTQDHNTLSVLKAQLDRDLSESSFSDYIKSPAATKVESSVIGNIGSLMTRFEARSDPEWQDFKEIYVHNLNEVNMVPRNTICYTIIDKYPPVTEIELDDGRIAKIDWQTPEPWSLVFGGEIGNSLLNAVAMNMPVKLRTRVENWKNPDLPMYEKVKTYGTRYNSTWTEFFTYVFQDFIIEIGENNNLLVKYVRSSQIETNVHEYQRSRKTWKDWLVPAGILIVAVVAVAVAVAAAATVTAVGGTTTGGAVAGGGTAAGTGAAATTTTAVAAPTAVAGSTGSGLTTGLTLSGAGSTSAAGSGLTLAGGSTAIAAPTAVAGGTTTGLSLSTVSTYAGYVSTGAGIVSKVAAAGGDTKTAQTAGAVSAVSGAVGGGTGAYAGGAGAFESAVEGATPLLGYAAQAYTTNQMKKLEGGPMMGDVPINGAGHVDIDQPAGGFKKSALSDIPMEYLAIGGMALAAIMIMTSSKGKR